ncbi:MAG TPA: hypothetical protein H9674_08350 [Firmicutes bacterium]|nr:hypothetical protein [Bacillota bacterium]
MMRDTVAMETPDIAEMSFIDKLFFKIPALREQTMRNRLPYSITKKEKSQLKTPYENSQKFMPIFYVGQAFFSFRAIFPFPRGKSNVLYIDIILEISRKNKPCFCEFSNGFSTLFAVFVKKSTAALWNRLTRRGCTFFNSRFSNTQ